MISRLRATLVRSLRLSEWLLLGAGVTACHQAPPTPAPVVADSVAAVTTPPAPFTRIPRNASRFRLAGSLVEQTASCLHQSFCVSQLRLRGDAIAQQRACSERHFRASQLDERIDRVLRNAERNRRK